jgi:hypothetical protein
MTTPPAATPIRHVLRKVVLSAAVIATLAGGVSLLVAAGRQPAEVTKAQTSDITSARRQAFDVTTTANGDLQAKNQIELRSTLERESSSRRARASRRVTWL